MLQESLEADAKKQSSTSTPSKSKQPKEPKEQKEQKGRPKPKENVVEDEFSVFAQAFLQVSKIVKAEKHPSADTLFKLQVQVGPQETDTKQVVSGIYNHYTADQLLHRYIVTIMNLKPVKLKGEQSDAMLLAGSNAQKQVFLLDPPSGSQIGDLVYVENKKEQTKFHGTSAEQRCSPKNWEKVVEGLKVLGGKATFLKQNLVTDRGYLTVAQLEDGCEIH